jgi:5-(carboxyamino)imidazole ribonucleotide mutase
MAKPKSRANPTLKPVAIIMGSQTDLKVMREAREVLKEFNMDCELKILSAHRTPEEVMEFARTAHAHHQVIIAGAGGAAHLPGLVAAVTCLPVIGVPVEVGSLKGLDALLSIVQMPKGTPVATVGINNARNAGMLAMQILALQNPQLFGRLQAYKKKAVRKVRASRSSLKALLTSNR